MSAARKEPPETEVGEQGLPMADRPRILMDAREKVERDIDRERSDLVQRARELEERERALERERAQMHAQTREQVSLNTRRDITCYVMTAAELGSLLVADTLMISCAAVAALVCGGGLVAVLVEPGFRDIAMSAAIVVATLSSIGFYVSWRWRKTTVRGIRNGGFTDAHR